MCDPIDRAVDGDDRADMTSRERIPRAHEIGLGHQSALAMADDDDWSIGPDALDRLNLGIEVERRRVGRQRVGCGYVVIEGREYWLAAAVARKRRPVVAERQQHRARRREAV